jgi:ParD-like antitoxin of type II bacterial toxin-antitoxin system
MIKSAFMGAVIKLSDKLLEEAKRSASIYHRSIPKQIEYWSCIGKIAEENSELPYSFIKDILFALEEVSDSHNQLEDYKFSK